MAYNGTSFLNSSHRLRYACVIDFILKRYVNKSSDCFNIKTKLFYNYGEKLIETWKYIQKTTENNTYIQEENNSITIKMKPNNFIFQIYS